MKTGSQWIAIGILVSSLASVEARAQAMCGNNLSCSTNGASFQVNNSYNGSHVSAITATATYGYAVQATSSGTTGTAGVRGIGHGNGSADGVLGESANANGVVGSSSAHGASGVYAFTTSETLGYAVAARHQGGSGAGVYIDSSQGGDYGLYQTGGGTNYFSGSISKPGGSFEIDHPLDPANKILFHSFVESPDMKNIYDGVVLLDGKGAAIVTMPSYFEALNQDFRYQLTCIGGHAPVYVAKEMRGNQFVIAGGAPGLKVSWQVTGTRHDAWAKAHPIYPEMCKSDPDRGKYLHAKEAGMPVESQIKNKTPFRRGDEAKSRVTNSSPTNGGRQ